MKGCQKAKSMEIENLENIVYHPDIAVYSDDGNIIVKVHYLALHDIILFPLNMHVDLKCSLATLSLVFVHNSDKSILFNLCEKKTHTWSILV